MLTSCEAFLRVVEWSAVDRAVGKETSPYQHLSSDGSLRAVYQAGHQTDSSDPVGKAVLALG